ncbi:MAG: carbohydrate kinase family protein, partial [Lachnospiraceae bacterium]|nr:carbohydrate kinase family protein [Lachnospiraceae bacterium]
MKAEVNVKNRPDGAQQKLRPLVVCVGQAVVDCITRDIKDDESGLGKTTAGSITLSTGGDAVNESFALTALGVPTGLVCAAGYDHAGQMLVGEARRRGVITDG